MKKDAADILAALKTETKQVAYRESLLLKVEALWGKDPKFRAAIRGLVKNSPIKDKRGNKSVIDTDLVKGVVKLGTKLGLKKNKILDIATQHSEPKSIERALLRDKKKRSQPT